MNKKLLACFATGLLILTTTTIAWAVDDATIQQIQNETAIANSKASEAKNKADGNDSKITGLYDNVSSLQQQIDNIQLTPGPKGDTGDQGIQGLKGDTGATGATGAAGSDGAPGAPGATGAQGSQGETGATGSDGATGATGPKGDTGPTGPAGAVGAQGPKGDTGPTGPAGSDGALGPKGDKGDQGDQGIQGVQGIQGDKGDTGSQGSQGVAGPPGDKGDKGDKGDPGEVPEMPGVEFYEASTTIPNDGEPHKMFSITITVPKDGYVVLSASGFVQGLYSTTNFYDTLYIGINPTNIPNAQHYGWYTKLETRLFSGGYQIMSLPFSIQKVKYLTKGSYIFSLDGRNIRSDGVYSPGAIQVINGAKLIGMYFPVRY